MKINFTKFSAKIFATFFGLSLFLPQLSMVTITHAAATPALPQATVSTQYPAVRGKTIAAPDVTSFKTALASAVPGDEIVLQAGMRYVGNFTLPNKTGSDWIIIRTSASNQLPTPGNRINPSQHTALLATIASPNSDPAIITAPGAHHYRLVGLNVTLEAGQPMSFGLVTFGNGNETTKDILPHNIIVDRSYIHGQPTVNVKRGITFNGSSLAVVDSYISDIHVIGQDTQAVFGSNGPGPFAIVNNYLEGAGENIMFGGADPSIANLVPADIVIRNNDFFKPLSWKVGHPTYAGKHWTIKNLLELKNAQRVLIDANRFQNNWADAQNGFAILFTVRNQDGAAPWSAVRDVTFSNNTLRGSTSGINILGKDDIYSSQQTQRISIRNNLFTDIGGSQWGGAGRLFQVLNGAADVTFDHNTASNAGSILTADSAPSTGVVFTNNIANHNDYGIIGTGTGVGNATLSQYFPNAVVSRNILIGGHAQHYPSNNFFPATIAEVGFRDAVNNDFSLRSDSAFIKSATDGGAVGWQSGTTTSPQPAPEPIPVPQPQPTPTPVPEPSPTPAPAPQPTPVPSPVPAQVVLTSTNSVYDQLISGQSASITCQFSNPGSTAKTVLLDLELYNSQGQKVAQVFKDNVTLAGQATTSMTLTSPALVPGTYSFSVGIFNPGFNGLITWHHAIKTLTVVAPAGPAPVSPANIVLSGVTSANESLSVGQSANLSAQFTNLGGAAKTVLLDLELYNSQGQKVAQVFKDNVTMSGQTTTSLSVTSPLLASGIYKVSVGIFNVGFNGLITWYHAIKTITVK
jgi:hypothetical protein